MTESGRLLFDFDPISDAKPSSIEHGFGLHFIYAIHLQNSNGTEHMPGLTAVN